MHEEQVEFLEKAVARDQKMLHNALLLSIPVLGMMRVANTVASAVRSVNGMSLQISMDRVFAVK